MAVKAGQQDADRCQPAGGAPGWRPDVVASATTAGLDKGATGCQDSYEDYGEVSLVGAGPGDPELLTVRGLRRLEAAEVVLHDSLISDEVLSLVPPSSQLINVGKRCGDIKDRGLQQREIHDLMLLHCRRGRRVVRLKCGDPFVYGRGAEELEFLAKHGVRAEVVPGVTSALGAAASCQLPLTHREFGANQVRLMVGQSKARALPELDWAGLAKDAHSQTAVFYMGMRSLDGICTRLKEHGVDGSMPMALVESATTPAERAMYGTLDTLPDIARKNEAGATNPGLVFLGPTAAFPAHIDKMVGDRPSKRLKVCSDEC